MDTFARDLRYAVRTLLHMRGVALVAILTLALGIGATTTMFSVVYAMLLMPPPFAEPDRLVILFNTSVTPRDGLQRLRWSLPNITELERVATLVRIVGSFTGPLFTVSGRGEPEHVDGETVSRGYFQALRVRPIAGRTVHRRRRLGGGRAAGRADRRALVEAAARRRSPRPRQHADRQRRAADDHRHPAGRVRRSERQGRDLDRAADGGAPVLRRVPDDAAELHQRRRAAEGRRQPAAGERRARGDRARLHRQRIGARHVWSAAAVPLREAARRSDRAAVGARAARRRRLRAADRLRQRRRAAARARPHAAARDRGAPGDRIGPAAAGAAAADRRAAAGRARRMRRHAARLVGRRPVRADGAGGDRERPEQLRRDRLACRAGARPGGAAVCARLSRSARRCCSRSCRRSRRRAPIW